MSITALKAELAQLLPEQRQEIVGYLVALNRTAEEEQALRSELARKIEDNNPAHWVALEQAGEIFLK